MIRPWSVAGEIGAGRPWRRSESHRLNTHGWRLWPGFPLIGLCRTGRRQAGKRRLGVVILASLMLLPLVFSIATGAFATNAAAQTTQGFLTTRTWRLATRSPQATPYHPAPPTR